MAINYGKARRWLRSHPSLNRLARSAVRLVPDVTVSRDIPELGRFRFGLRRHRWLLGRDCLAGHVTNFATFRRLIRPGDVVYDVGANIGYYARYVLAHCEPSRLIAFEPMRENHGLLAQNLALAADPGRATALDIALSDRDGDEALRIDDAAGGTAALASVAGDAATRGATQTVRVRRLDSLISSERLPSPAMIKIDTEGAEVRVIDGAKQTLAEFGPRLAIALHGPDMATAVIERLTGLGYACAGRVGADGWRPLRPDDGPRLADNNIIASRDGDDAVEPVA